MSFVTSQHGMFQSMLGFVRQSIRVMGSDALVLGDKNAATKNTINTSGWEYDQPRQGHIALASLKTLAKSRMSQRENLEETIVDHCGCSGFLQIFPNKPFLGGLQRAGKFTLGPSWIL